MLKAKEICNRVAFNVPYVMVISYILDKGESMIKEITDEDIANIEGNALMTEGFVKAMVRAAREVVRECTQDEIIQLIKAEWCCSGEEYDPDKEQFVKADWYDEEEDDEDEESM